MNVHLSPFVEYVTTLSIPTNDYKTNKVNADTNNDCLFALQPTFISFICVQHFRSLSNDNFKNLNLNFSNK